MKSFAVLLYVLGCTLVAGQTLDDALEGVPGQDFPIYAEVPDTGFSCDGRINGGYYADPQAQCQAFHVCSNNIRYSFLCPNGTLFSQIYFVCDWWYNFDCAFAEQLYVLNEQLFTDAEFDGRQFAQDLGIVVGSASQTSSVVASGVRGVNGVSGITSVAGGRLATNGGSGFGNGNGQGSVFVNGRGSGFGNGQVGGVATGYGAPSSGR